MGKTDKEARVRRTRKIIQTFFFILLVLYVVELINNGHSMVMDIIFVTFGIILLMTILLRTGFCGWICPLGAFVDSIRSLGKKIGSSSMMKPINKKYKSWVKKNKTILNKIDNYARLLKYVFMLWILAIYFFHLPGAGSGNRVVSYIYLVVYIVLLVISFLVDRAWCRYVCPLGALLGIFGKLSPTSVTRDEDLCIGCNMCTRSCPMSIDVANIKHVKNFDCSTCLKCVDACPVDKALDLRMKISLGKKSNTKTLETIKE